MRTTTMNMQTSREKNSVFHCYWSVWKTGDQQLIPTYKVKYFQLILFVVRNNMFKNIESLLMLFSL